MSILIDNSVIHTGRRMEDFLNTKLERKVPDRETNYEGLGLSMIEAGNELGPGTQYGKN